MSEFKSYRKESLKDWGQDFEAGSKLSIEQIQTGALLRIADASELMAKNYVSMQSDLDWYKRKAKEREDMIKHYEKSNAALRGHIKRLKNKSK